MSEKLFKPDGEQAYELLRRTSPTGADYVLAWRLAQHRPYVVCLVNEKGECSGNKYFHSVVSAIRPFMRATNIEFSPWTERQLREEALSVQDGLMSDKDDELENCPCAPAGQYCPKCDDVHCSSVDGHKWSSNHYCTECGADGAG